MDEPGAKTDAPGAKTEESRKLERGDLLEGVIDELIEDLKSGRDDSEKRRQVEDWLRSLADKYPEFPIEQGLRDYYLAEAERLRGTFTSSTDLAEKLALGRSVEGYLEKAAEIERRAESES
jgi:hypothetical protein